MIKNIRWPVYFVVLTLTLFPVFGSYYAIKGITDSASTLGLSPAVIGELDNASGRLKELAKINPAGADSYRSEFNHLQETKQNYQVLLDLSPALSRSYLEIFFIIFGIALAGGLVLAAWLNRKIIRSHDQAISGMKMAEERNAYLENREAWRLIAQKFVHEVKNPLTPIKVMVGHLLAKYQATHTARDSGFEEVLQETREMLSEETAKITRWVEAFSKYAQIPDAKVSRIDLQELLSDFSHRHREYWPNVTVTILPSNKPAVVSADAELFKQVLFNLIKNSNEAVASRPLQIQISLEEASDGALDISLQDDGPGLPEKLKNSIFKPYQSSKTELGGMGLGLAISKKIMLAQGGDIQWKPSDSGCTFLLKLPYWAPE